MSKPTGNPAIQFRAAPEVLDPIRSRMGPGESVGEVVRRDLMRYYAVIDLELARLNLTEGEAALICDALNGYAIWSDDSLVLRSWWIAVEDHITLNGAAEKWDIDQPAVFVAKLRSLSPGASAAVLDAVARWWGRQPTDGETIGESLRSVGLVR